MFISLTANVYGKASWDISDITSTMATASLSFLSFTSFLLERLCLFTGKLHDESLFTLNSLSNHINWNVFWSVIEMRCSLF